MFKLKAAIQSKKNYEEFIQNWPLILEAVIKEST